ncbi:MAG: hypothetical protein GY714_08705 [Desulfobacterales bacterium]|nr:hypothetical protein [Desulfobacterales bacterium]MCP4163819.1 hypothetical protein [Deltaproteobacteria bacterium]
MSTDSESKKVNTGIAISIIVPVIIMLFSGWYLIFKLKIIEAPKLVIYFPGAYLLPLAAFVASFIVLIFMLFNLKK